MYADKDGHLRDSPARRLFCIVDGIVGGEGNGPLDPAPKPAGLVVSGRNPVAVELTCARLMGFDYKHLPLLCRPLADHSMPVSGFEYDEVVCKSTHPQFNRTLAEFDGMGLAFKPHFGWQGHVELSGE